MNAPECKNCVCAVTKIGYRCDASIPKGGEWVPGTACPFLVINAQEAELAAKDVELNELRGESIRLRGEWCGAHALALLVLQSKCYHDPEIRDAVDTVLALNLDGHKSIPELPSCPDCAAKEAENARLRALVAAIAYAPFPIHDYVTKEQWEQACDICAALEEVK